MNMMRKNLAALLVLLLAAVSVAYAQKSAQCLAVITGIKGSVMIKQSDQKEFSRTTWGTQLYQGDKIKTGTDSQASLTFSDGNIMEVGGGSEVTISGKPKAGEVTGGNVKKVSSAAMMIDISTLASKRESKTDMGTLAGLRAVDIDKPIELVTPFNSLIRTNKPSFSWESKKAYDMYVVNLYSAKGLVWSKKAAATTLNFPEDQKALDPGETYFWNVEGEGLLENEKSGNLKFSVISGNKSQEVLAQEEQIRKTFGSDSVSSTFHTILGTYYMNQGLLQDAIREFRIISLIYPDASLPHEILGSLYSDTGNKDQAIEELRKALALTKAGEK
jgi:hypothetical protein